MIILILETSSLSFDAETDRELLNQWIKILFDYCNFQFIDNPQYLGPLVKVAKILSVYHMQKNPDKLFEIKSLNVTLKLDQILDILRNLEENQEYYEKLIAE